MTNNINYAIISYILMIVHIINSMNLTEEQQRFLIKFVNNRGDFYATLDAMGLEYSHILSWKKSYKDFDKQFAEARQEVIGQIKEENYIQGLRELHSILKFGVTEYTIQKRQIKAKLKSINDDDESSSFTNSDDFVTEVTEKWVKKGVPLSAITKAINESSIVNAASILANEGVIPSTVAKKMILGAERISKEITDSFESNADNDVISEKKALALIKTAILGKAEL